MHPRFLSMVCLFLILLPLAAAAMPAQQRITEAQGDGWWVDTTVDRNKNSIGDMVEKFHDHPLFLDEDSTLPLIIDFDHTPTKQDIAMLEREVSYQHQWTLRHINAVAGRVPHHLILETTSLPGVVMLELDGILTVQNGDSAVIHEVDLARQATGYDGSGVTVAIIDTGIDSLHVGLDDMDDDPTTFDPKVIGFYDAVNNPDKTNGTEIQAYDDQGHGSHCAGTVAGTGAPTYEHPGMAPQAFLVGVKVLDAGGSGSFATVMAGMEWTVDHRFVYNIRAASMSLGGPGPIEWTSSEEDSVNRYANEMVRAGITMAIAAGNNAVSAQIGTPGSAEDVITVGALDKNTAIAIYSSQGPTEEGRIKPNVAFVGSNVNSVAFNTGDQYRQMSGTSMATPGVAGTIALMLQANPDLSPFDVRNILQETATYRVCHYMLANEPCFEDQLPKNRQNNVYGHGHVEAYDAVMEAAQRDYQLDTTRTLVIATEVGADDRIHLKPGQSIVIDVQGDIDTLQWRSNHLRDDWANLHTFDEGDAKGMLDLSTIVHQLEHLPGIVVEGNHTLSLRGLIANQTDSTGPPSSTALITVNVMLMDTANAKSFGEEDGLFSGLSNWVVPATAIMLVLFVILGMYVMNKVEDATIVESALQVDDDIEAVVQEAELEH